MKILPIALSLSLVLPVFSGAVTANQTAPVSVASDTDKVLRTNEFSILGWYNIKTLSFKVDYANKKLVTTFADGKAHPSFGNNTYYTIKVTGLDGTVKANVSVKGVENSSIAGKALNNLAIEEGDLITITHEEAPSRFKVTGDVVTPPANGYYSKVSNFYVVGDTLEYSNENKAELQAQLKTAVNLGSTYKADMYNTKGFAALEASLKKGEDTLKSGTNQALKEVTAEIYKNISNLKDKNRIDVLAWYNIQKLSFTIDYQNNKIKVLNQVDSTHPAFGDSVYYSIKVTDKDGKVKADVSVKGNEPSTKAGKVLDNLAVVEGDLITITHQEANGRLKFYGAIQNHTPNQPNKITTTFEIGNDELIRK